MAERDLASEIADFDGLWQGGYFEGDPTQSVGRSSYANFGYISILYATYLRCIRPFIKPETVALEIGPGRGTWTKGMLAAREIWTVDALSAEYNRFFEYLGNPENVKYFQVRDFELKELPDDHFTFCFSFGCLCHVSFDGIAEYARNLFPKLKPGSSCFWMVADKSKFNSFLAEADRFDIWKQASPKRRGFAPVGMLFDLLSRFQRPEFLTTDPFAEQKGKWHEAGIDRTCEMLEEIGYEIIERDVGTIPRDPIIYFMKPNAG